MKQTKYFTVFSQKLAGYLMIKGFVLKDMRQDEKGSGKNIFFFKNTESLKVEIMKYKGANDDRSKNISNRYSRL